MASDSGVLAGTRCPRAPGVDLRLSAHELPDVFVERTKRLLDVEEGFRIAYRGCDFEPVANDAGVAQQAFELAPIVASDALRVEAIEGGAVVLAFLQDGVPAETGLRAFENEELEESAVIVLRQSPLFVVIADRQRVARPGAADQI